MHAQLFKDRRVIAKYRRGPLLAEREVFLFKRHDQGFAKATLMEFARLLLFLSRRVRLIAKPGVAAAEIVNAAERWTLQNGRFRSTTEEQLISLTKDWFAELGWLSDEQHPWSAVLLKYKTSLEEERGLASKTVAQHCWYVKNFLEWCPESLELNKVSFQDVDRFFVVRSGDGWSRLSVACAAKVLRSFFRWALDSGLCIAPIANAIEAPRIYAQERLPSGPAWSEVIRLVQHLDSGKFSDTRDRAIVLLCATYGLRSNEVSHLMLEDFDWTHMKIRIWRPKQRRQQEYPLISAVGHAIVDYLQFVRPKSQRREVFLTLQAPFIPLSAAVIYEVVSSRFKKLGITSRNRGPHSLRHACATHLLEEGFSMKEIGDHLGHRCLSVTQTYAKVNIKALREIAKLPERGVI